MTQLVQNPFKTRLKGVLLLHLNHNLSTEMTLLVGMLVFINKLPRDFDGKICHLYENIQNRLQNKNKFDGVRKLASKPYFQAKFKMATISNVIKSPSIIEMETKLFLQTIRFRYQRMQ